MNPFTLKNLKQLSIAQLPLKMECRQVHNRDMVLAVFL